MIKHIWSVLCLKSVINKDTNAISLLDCVERINVGVPISQDKIEKGKKILAPVEFEIVSLWFRENVSRSIDLTEKMKLYGPDDELISTFSQKLLFPKDKKRLRSRVTVKGLPIKLSGKYVIEVISEENKRQHSETKLPFEIIITYNESIGSKT